MGAPDAAGVQGREVLRLKTVEAELFNINAATKRMEKRVS